MALDQVRTVNFGRTLANATGSLGVGYALLDVSGSAVGSRTTSGVYQLTSGSGIYSAYVSFPDDFRGQILWDTGSAFSDTYYAAENYNVEANNPKTNEVADTVGLMSGTLSQLYNINFGRWRIVSNQMVFYADDNTTELVRFNLYDDVGAPTSDAVFERTKV